MSEKLIADDANRKRRIAREVLHGTDVYVEGEGPEGPWDFGVITIRRHMNRITIRDADGVLVNQFTPDASTTVGTLAGRIAREESAAADSL